jgi:hypothetical protein
MIFESIIATLFVVNLYVAYRVIRNDELEKAQKILQITLIFLLPFVGGICILVFILNIEKNHITATKEEFGEGQQNTLSSKDIYLGSDDT